jgi:predicted DNA binding CopG/RHH family protein
MTATAGYEKKKVPKLKTDKKAEAFLAQDLSDLDFSQLKPARFAFEKKADQKLQRN